MHIPIKVWQIYNVLVLASQLNLQVLKEDFQGVSYKAPMVKGSIQLGKGGTERW